MSRITIGTLKDVPELPSHQYDPTIDDSMNGDDHENMDGDDETNSNTSLPMM